MRGLGLTLAAACAAWLAWWAWPDGAHSEAAAARQAARGGFAPSLIGTRPDGAAAEADGKLVVDQQLRQLFDYYLATLGERDLAAIRTELQGQLKRSLKNGPLAQAMGLFDRYVGYKRSLAGKAAAAATDLSHRLELVQAARRQYFSQAELDGLFGDEDRYDDFTARRLAIEANPALSADEKRRRVAQLEQQLPPGLRAAREEPVKHLALADAEAWLRQGGGGEQQLYQLRAGMVGQAAADRLGELDREQAAWQNRVDDFKRERTAILADGGLSPQQRQQALARLQAQRFSQQESLRLPAYLSN
ncbi:lipase chaperone [Chromobacterium violaceum]|uniref:lipase secretion chaperone n=1 Tax=Chromobacterium violaceum TaxID=536 RepID=UPI0009DA684E|nr:lipase secretion chaperone [Chromobacterium violaceum]OQS45969.1 lipase chaperone [Chromobacterium violaceum]OQS47937.1 lipase chaperone [Chromobacterium violaceum]